MGHLTALRATDHPQRWLAVVMTVLSLGLLAPAASARQPRLRVPVGFTVQTYTTGLQGARLMAVAPNGDVFVSETRTGRVVVLPDRNRDGRPERVSVFASGLNRPHGLAFHGAFLYVANTNAVVR